LLLGLTATFLASSWAGFGVMCRASLSELVDSTLRMLEADEDTVTKGASKALLESLMPKNVECLKNIFARLSVWKRWFDLLLILMSGV
jgi:hypothetical protein